MKGKNCTRLSQKYGKLEDGNNDNYNLYKKGNTMKCGNYKGIFLLCILRKVEGVTKKDKIKTRKLDEN